MHSFGYGFTPPFLTYHITDPDSSLVHHEVVDIPRSTMMHDFPAGGDPDDDAGYLLTYVHDEAIDVSELVIVDASDALAGPVARIKLPTRVPYGFHATWIPD